MNPLTLSFAGDNEKHFLVEYTEKSIKQIRFAVLLGILLYASFGVLDIWIVPEIKSKVWFIRYVIVCPLFLFLYALTYFERFRNYIQLIFSLFILIAGFGIIFMIIFAFSTGSYLYYAGLLLCTMFSYTFLRLRFVYATINCLILILTYEILAIWINNTPLPILMNNTFFLVSANIIGMSASYFMEFYSRRDFIQRHIIAAEEKKSEKLLLNILPKGIAERLKQEDADLNIKYSKVIVDNFPDVTVLFADIVEFTDLSSRISPESLVVFLNELFFIFDNLAEKHGLEKIKTSGDSYMVVGGLPEPLSNHPGAIAEMALDMQEEVNKIESAKEGWLRIRIGIHTGAVVAGVIGRKKFSYDVWGNTVNIASSMEHNSVAGNILVSEETYKRLLGNYSFIERGEIEVKGKGSMKTYFLAGRKLENTIGSAETERGNQLQPHNKLLKKVSALNTGENIGPYVLLNKLGNGAFGVVWLAERQTSITTTKVALKIPLASEVDLETIKQEANLWVQASGHPNVLPIIEANVYDNQVVIASEYVPDGSLNSWLKQNGGKAPTVVIAVEITSGILAGLEHLHAQNIIHRDLKPDNILMQKGIPRLADFGISRILRASNHSTIAAGTPAYMAPEAFDGIRSEQTDLWAVGIIFYQLLSGRLPFPQTDMASLLAGIITHEPEPLTSISEDIQQIVRQALEKKPSKRYKTATEMRQVLRNINYQTTK